MLLRHWKLENPIKKLAWPMSMLFLMVLCTTAYGGCGDHLQSPWSTWSDPTPIADQGELGKDSYTIKMSFPITRDKICWTCRGAMPPSSSSLPFPPPKVALVDSTLEPESMVGQPIQVVDRVGSTNCQVPELIRPPIV